MSTSFVRRAVRVVLTKREKQAIDYITNRARTANAFSISFDVTARRMRSLVYFQQPNFIAQAAGSEDANKENGQQPPAPPAPSAPSASSSSSRTQVQEKEAQKRVQKQVASQKKVDRNTLSARSGTILSDAAIAAQARADLASSTVEPPAKKRRAVSPKRELDSWLSEPERPALPRTPVPANLFRSFSSGDNAFDPKGYFTSDADAAEFLAAYLEGNNLLLNLGDDPAGTRLIDMDACRAIQNVPPKIVVAYTMLQVRLGTDGAFDLVEIKQSAIRKQGKFDVGHSPRYDHIGGYSDGSSRSVSPS
jgi:hypothetical protein